MFFQSKSLSYRFFSLILSLLLITTLIIPPTFVQAAPVINLPAVGSMVTPTGLYAPAVIRGVTINPDNALQFDFIVDRGDSDLEGDVFRQESTKLVKYFLAALTVPEDEMWVNLSPYEKNRVIPEGFGKTEMGRDLLAQDYILKQLTASLLYPENELGSDFWERVYAKAQAEYGTTDIPMNTFNKVWIVPQEAKVYEHEKGAFIVSSYLNVMLEEDYAASLSVKGKAESPLGDEFIKVDEVSKEIIRDLIIPEIEKEVNQGEIFANLRQVYHSMILAVWYKNALKESLLGQVYVNQNKTKGIDFADKQANERIYNQYIEAFQKGVFEFIKEDYNETTGDLIPKRYFSGGIKSITQEDFAMSSEEEVIEAVRDMADRGSRVTVNLENTDAAKLSDDTVQLEDLVPVWRAHRIRILKQLPAIIRHLEMKNNGWNIDSTELETKNIFLNLTDGKNAALSIQQMAGMQMGDEAYAGSNNFYAMVEAIKEHLGYEDVVPTHAGVGSVHILNNVITKRGDVVFTNGGSKTSEFHVTNRLVPQEKLVEGFAEYIDIADSSNQRYGANIDVQTLREKIKEYGAENVSYVSLHTNPARLAEQPFSLENLKKVRDLTRRHGIPIILDGSNLIGAAYAIKEREVDYRDKSIQEIILEITSLTDGITVSAGSEFLTNTGGFIAYNRNARTKERDLVRRTQAEIVVYEGLHTYGGMAGRDMEVMAQGISDAVQDVHVHQRVAQTRYLAERLFEKGVPLITPLGTSSVFIDADRFFPDIAKDLNRAEVLAKALYVRTGILTSPGGSKGRSTLRLYVPARAFSRKHLDYVADMITLLYEERGQITVETSKDGRLMVGPRDFLLHHTLSKDIVSENAVIEPYSLGSTKESRREALKEGGYNTFLLKMADGVTLDLLTDSGTTALSTRQWAEIVQAIETGNDWGKAVEQAVQDAYGYTHVIPTHQGRMAELVISQLWLNKGDVVVGNMYFTTTKFHQQFAGAKFIDLIIDEGKDTTLDHPFKGNLDLEKLEKLIEERIAEFGSPKLPYVAMAGPVNMNGGQPFSMENLKGVREIADRYSEQFPDDPIRIVFDATRAMENAYFIKQREEGYQDKTSAQILREMVALTEAGTMSSKKDNLVNIGGFLAFNDEQAYLEAKERARLFDGASPLAQRNMAAFSLGIREMLNEKYITERVEQVRKFAEALQTEGVPIMLPPGGHAVVLDALKFMQDDDGNSLLPREQYVAQSLAAAIFEATGIRSMERGAVSAGRDLEGNEIFPELELVRLTIPRRVYSDEQFEVAAKQIGELYRNRHSIKGLKMVYEPDNLRFFQARFEAADKAMSAKKTKVEERPDTIIINASELVTAKGVAGRPKVGEEMDDLGVIKNGAVAIKDGNIAWVGETDQLFKELAEGNISRESIPKIVDATGKLILPGLVDPHTHAVYAGTRENEFAQKLKGVSYTEIEAAGGGILSTVNNVRAATMEEIVELAMQRLSTMLSHGTTSVEIKSGYGLDFENEIKLLEAARELKSRQEMDIVTTFLGAHTTPLEFRGRSKDYLDQVREIMLPEVKERELARYVDIFIEQGSGFSIEDSREFLDAVQDLGLELKFHTNQLSDIGGAELAARYDAVSADHLDVINESSMTTLAEANVIGILLPTAPLHLLMNQKQPLAPARAMINKGMALALATDHNPGTSPTLSMPFVMYLAGRLLRLSPAEIINAVTINAAHAIGLGERVGSLEVGKQADLVIFDAPNHAYLVNQNAGINMAQMVIKKGDVVISDGKIGTTTKRYEKASTPIDISDLENIRAPRGSKLNTANWQIEAPLRMLLNNLDPEVAEDPANLIVYGGSGKAARNVEAFKDIVETLLKLQPNQTMLVQSGKPVLVIETHEDAPRVLIANSNLVGQWSNWEEFRMLEALGLIAYGQMTAGSWIYIGTQGILQGTYETFKAAAQKHFGGTLKGRLVVTGGMGGMGGAQPLAAKLNGASFLGVDVDRSRLEKRIETGYLDEIADDLDDAIERVLAAKAEGRALSVGLEANIVDVLDVLIERDIVPDVLTDQTSAHDELQGYVPNGMTFQEALELRESDSDAYIAASMQAMKDHVEAMVKLKEMGSITFDYGNNLRGQAEKAGLDHDTAFSFPGFVPAYVRPLFEEGKGAFRWAALSGDPDDIFKIDEKILADEVLSQNESVTDWIEKAREHVHFQGLPARIAWLGLGERARLGKLVNDMVASGELAAPIVFGRDHLDTGSVASPNRETESMKDGSDAIADWPLLNAMQNIASGATWVSIHNGGGVGIGLSQHAGMVIVADGTKEAEKRLERVLTNDPAIGVARHADAGYLKAIETALSKGVNIPGLKAEEQDSDNAQVSENPGGIDFNPALFDMQIERNGNGVSLPISQQAIQDMNIEGFVPVIINVAPITNLHLLLGLNETEKDGEEPSLLSSREPMDRKRLAFLSRD